MSAQQTQTLENLFEDKKSLSSLYQTRLQNFDDSEKLDVVLIFKDDDNSILGVVVITVVNDPAFCFACGETDIFGAAKSAAWMLGLNPGGSVSMSAYDHKTCGWWNPKVTYRLLSKEEAIALKIVTPLKLRSLSKVSCSCCGKYH